MIDAAGIALHGQRRDAGLCVRADQRTVARAEQPRRGDLQRGQPRVLRRGRPVAILRLGSLLGMVAFRHDWKWALHGGVQWTADYRTICVKHSHHILSWNTHYERVPVVSVTRAKPGYRNAPNV